MLEQCNEVIIKVLLQPLETLYSVTSYQMKKLLLSFIVLLMGTGMALCQGQPKIEFKDTMQYDMGTFTEGETAVHTFEFTNVGSGNFYIKEVRTTCSCTATDWPKEPVKPGETSSIKVTFDTNHKNGEYAKGVNIFSNAGELNLIIIVRVKPKAEVMPIVKPKVPVEDDPHAGHDHD